MWVGLNSGINLEHLVAFPKRIRGQSYDF
jgi:hypothetical protein